VNIVSLIGALEQINLPGLLQRVETYSKTGLLVIKQGTHWVEFYFREGQLICIGPVRTSANLGERLLQDGIISLQALRQVTQALGADQASEIRMARTLMEMGCVEHTHLRMWATLKVADVLKVVLTWTSGEIYFEEDVTPPADRLLVALAVSPLLSAVPPTVTPSHPMTQYAAQNKRTAYQEKSPVQGQAQRTSQAPTPDIVKLPTLMSASQFFQGTPPATSLPATESLVVTPPVEQPAAFLEPSGVTSPSGSLFPPHQSAQASTTYPTTESLIMAPDSSLPTTETLFGSFPATESLSPVFDGIQESGGAANTSISRPERVMNPVPPKHIDTSFMRPEMVLVPSDLSALREQNPPVQLTPNQWRVLTRVDGRTSLQTASQMLSMPPAMICQIAGELVAEGLIQLLPPEAVPPAGQELSPAVARQPMPNPTGGYIAPGYAAAVAQPWMAALPSSDVMPPAPSASFETESQWGNGGNGATFVPGQGWVASPQPLRPLQPGGPLAAHSGVYAQVGSGR
jgi:hypothetical protein